MDFSSYSRDNWDKNMIDKTTERRSYRNTQHMAKQAEKKQTKQESIDACKKKDLTQVWSKSFWHQCEES